MTRVVLIAPPELHESVIQALIRLRLYYKISSDYLSGGTKRQLSYAKRVKATDLIYLQGNKYIYQDLHEYPDWLCREYGTINFEKRTYNSIHELIKNELLFL